MGQVRSPLSSRDSSQPTGTKDVGLVAHEGTLAAELPEEVRIRADQLEQHYPLCLATAIHIAPEQLLLWRKLSLELQALLLGREDGEALLSSSFCWVLPVHVGLWL